MMSWQPLRSASLACALCIASVAGATELPTPLITVEVKRDIRVVYDVKTDEWEAGVGKALYYVRGLYEAYGKQGVPPEQVHVHIVLHGPSVYWLLNDNAYQKHVNDPFAYNPNQKIVEDLIGLGAGVEACNSAMKSKGWTAADLIPGVRLVHDGYTRIIDLQQRGYAYIRF